MLWVAVAFLVFYLAVVAAGGHHLWKEGRRRRALERAEQRRQGRCPGCGYDLRATPDRCPECGTDVRVDGERGVPSKLVRYLAVSVKGTEAAAFVVSGTSANPRLTNTVHIRPDDSSADVRARAVDAFREITEQAVAGDSDAVIEVGEVAGAANWLQFCIVVLVREKAKVRSAVAVVVQSRGQREAMKKLLTLRTTATSYGLEVGGDGPSPPPARGGDNECWN